MNKSAKFWNKRAAKFDTEDDPNSEVRKAKYEQIKKYLNKEQLVLDFGCAVGSLSQVIAPFVNEVHGVDISVEMIKIAKEKAQNNNINNIKFIEGDILNEKFDSSRYDVVVAMYVLHLVENPKRTLQRLVELINHQGFLILEVPCMKRFNFFKRFLFVPFIKLAGLPYLASFDSNNIDDMIKQNGLEIVETEFTKKKFPRYFIVAKKN